MSQGICVVDGQLRVVAWNSPYAELFNYPSGLLRIGCPIADLMHHNIRLGLIGKVNADAAVQRRLEHMRRGTRHQSERMLHGAVIEIRGNPMPGGGYVATFTDVTRFRQTEAALKRINETLEQRVEARTHELALATRAAEQANEAKGYFLAAVSHDLLQPLHAAQLFSQTLQESLKAQKKTQVAEHLINALDVTETLLVSLLDIASLESGEIEHRPRTFALNEILEPLEVEFSALAKAQGVALKFAPTCAWTRSDPQLLRRILQNFLANALRHAGGGRVLLAVRNSGPNLRIEVRDSGPGISAAEQKMIFQQFRRGKQASGQGLGLGLAIAERMAQLLDHPLGLRSQPGRGSVFFVLVPSVKPEQVISRSKAAGSREQPLAPGRVLVIDNDHDARQALTGLLESWGWQVHARAGMVEMKELPWPPDAAILDYHLDEGLTGMDVLCRLRQHNTDVPTAIVTADRDPDLRATLQAADAVVPYKPLKPVAPRQSLRRAANAARPACRLLREHPIADNDRQYAKCSSEHLLGCIQPVQNIAGLGAVLHFEFFQYGAHMCLDGAFLNAQAIGNLLVEQAIGHQPEHAKLLGRKPAKARSMAPFGRRARLGFNRCRQIRRYPLTPLEHGRNRSTNFTAGRTFGNKPRRVVIKHAPNDSWTVMG